MNKGGIDPVDRDGVSTVLGDYRLLLELGHGGTSRVFLAAAHGAGGTGRLVAVKTIHLHSQDDPETLAMFLDEAKIAARLIHPNIVETYATECVGGIHLIVMEDLDGVDLDAILRRVCTTLSVGHLRFCLRCVADVLRGLHYLHELVGVDGSPLGLVHRGVEPGNVFVTYDGRVKLLDFGIAKSSTSLSETRAGLVKGKIAFMAPEQMLGEVLDRRVDIYTMGAILWHMATGERLWSGVVDGQIIRRVLANDIPRPSTVNRLVDPVLESITMKALACDRGERHQTCLDLLSDVEGLLERLGGVDVDGRLGDYLVGLFSVERGEKALVVERLLAMSGFLDNSV